MLVFGLVGGSLTPFCTYSVHHTWISLEYQPFTSHFYLQIRQPQSLKSDSLRTWRCCPCLATWIGTDPSWNPELWMGETTRWASSFEKDWIYQTGLIIPHHLINANQPDHTRPYQTPVWSTLFCLFVCPRFKANQCILESIFNQYSYGRFYHIFSFVISQFFHVKPDGWAPWRSRLFFKSLEELGWRGILIEPSEIQPPLLGDRNGSLVMQTAICGQVGNGGEQGHAMPRISIVFIFLRYLIMCTPYTYITIYTR